MCLFPVVTLLHHHPEVHEGSPSVVIRLLSIVLSHPSP